MLTRWLVLTALLISFGTQGCVTSKGINSDASEARLERQIQGSSDLQALARICGDLGDLRGFVLRRRERNTHGRPALYYYFNSPLSLDQTVGDFKNFFEAGGWQRIDAPIFPRSLAFQKDETRVTIQYGGMREADYGITCELIGPDER